MKKILFAVALMLFCQRSALAGPGYYLISAYDNEGEKTVDFRFWNVKYPDAPAISAPEIGVGYGVSSRWYTELYAMYLHTADAGTRWTATNWQNEYLLTQGQYPFDLALHLNIERPRDSRRGYGVEFGPILQTDFGRTQVNTNLLFERQYRGETADATQMKYQWQVKYRWKPGLHVGVQGFGELGDWDHWAPRDRQSHRIGPVVAGTLPAGRGRVLKYEAAYLFGSIMAADAKTFSMRLQLAF